MGILCTLLQVLFLVVLASIILSWIPTSEGTVFDQVKKALQTITEPLFRPFRALLPPVRIGGAGLDLSPIFVILIIQIATAYVC